MLEVSLSKGESDLEWDNFLETRPDGCYQQSSMWAELKAAFGWKPLRMVVRENGEIVGGVQMLLRSLKTFGMVGYVSKGPVIAFEDPKVQEFILDQMDNVARKEHILFLKVQPSYGANDVAQCLVKRGALPSDMGVVSRATARVDLRPEPETILANMKSNRRGHIRRSERQGLVVREGADSDLSILLNLVKIHSEMQGYAPTPDAYRRRLWSIFSSRERASLFVAEYEGEVVAARINLIFGDVMFAKFVGDSGRHRKLNAQSYMQWKAMLWGREKGCAWYDFGGISLDTAESVMNGEHLPNDTRLDRMARFKMSFGSQAIIRPHACDVSYIWPRRLTGRIVPLLMKARPLIRSLLGGSLYGEFE